MIHDLTLALAVLIASAAVISLIEWLRYRASVQAAQAKARRDAASGLTAARLRHPSTRAKEND